MKKSIIVSALIVWAFSANAQTDQTALQGTKFWDNWSVEFKAGGITPLTHSSFFKDMRPGLGVGFSKQLTPVFGLGFQGMGYINTTQSKTAFDASDVSMLGKVNLMNLFGGYPGDPRPFEIEALVGIGWLHYYMNGPGDINSWSTRFGFNFNFNLGEEQAWTLGIKPAIIYDMEADFPRAKSRFNVNNASFEITAGITYHFMCSTGTHHFTKVRVYDQAQIDALNSSINDLRMQIEAKNNQVMGAAQKIGALQTELDNCRKAAETVKTVVKTTRIPETIVTFRQSSSVIDASQRLNVERVADYLKNHPNAKVEINGYASPEGNLDFNIKLAQARAESVKSMLIKKYKISSTRITAKGKGIGDMFSEPTWNRVSICTIED
ncbi:OmpA family protein [Coprobacter tertius]|uniref:OmpA family protein n=1 Tax=Coprobacter tertius TaxID=2944915 RepID=A0ABT1MKQ5_9BACT|nr:OmpA family protein [Coprobacter tertius]MCP9612446.1 OmpA family protein [Coprobacter tertius]